MGRTKSLDLMSLTPAYGTPPMMIPNLSHLRPRVETGDVFFAGFANVRSFGGTTMIGGKPTAMYCDDALRNAYLPESLAALFRNWPSPCPRSSLPGFLGFAEVWDREYAQNFFGSEPFRHHETLLGFFERGLPEILDAIPKDSFLLHYTLNFSPDVFVRHFARSQLLAGAIGMQGSESTGLFNAMFRSARQKIVETVQETMADLEKKFEGRKFFGSGAALAVNRRYKILNHKFIPFDSEKYGLDRYARKGILSADAELPNGRRVSVFVVHLHVGDSVESCRARDQQIRQFQDFVTSAPYPVMVLLDSNIIAEKWNGSEDLVATEEYLSALQTLGLKDAFRTIHPDATDMPGFTYDDATHFSEKLKIECAKDSPMRFQRLDGIWYGPGLHPVFAGVLPLIHSKYRGKPLTDHHQMVVSALEFCGP